MADKTKLASASARAKVPRRSNRAPEVKAVDLDDPAGWTVPEWLEPFEQKPLFADEA